MLEMKVSVVIPTLNEEDGIGNVLNKIPRDTVDEVIVVDSSNDATAKIAQSFGAKVVREQEKGYGKAYKTGFKEAKGEILVTLDGDSSYPVAYIPKLVQLLIDKELDFITTNRLACSENGSMNTANHIGNLFLSLLVRILFSVKINDSQSGMWVFKRSVLGHILPISNGMSFSEEIKIRAFKNKLRALEVPVVYQKRKGRAKLSPVKDGLKNLGHLFRLWLRLNGHNGENAWIN